MNAVAILEIQWGHVASPTSRRFFTINPENFTGRRLHRWLAPHDPFFLVTNACPGVVASAKEHGTPSPEWLSGNLRAIQEAKKIDLVLVCGAVAQATYRREDLEGARIIEIPHPAARTWSLYGMDVVSKVIADPKQVAVRVVRESMALWHVEKLES